jgi:predicted phage baseplate assembly protein
VAFRIPAGLDWPADLRPGQRTGAPLRWLRARLLTATFRPEVRLLRVVLNGVSALSARSVRGEVAQPLERRATGGASYRLASTPVLPGSVVLDVTEPASSLGGPDTVQLWTQVSSLAASQPDDRVFVLDPSEGTVTFGDGVHGRAVPEGYRNVVARSYRTGGGTDGLPAVGDVLPPEVSTPDLTGLRVVTITTGSPAESATVLLRRGPGEIRSRARAVAGADYAVSALSTPGVDIARARALPAHDPLSGTERAGTVGLVVVPRSNDRTRPPVPSSETLQLVADHLAGTTGVVGARVVAAAPRYREVAVQGLLVGRVGADLAALTSAARTSIDTWLDPLVGGDGTGWEFGAAVRWNALVRMLLAVLRDLEAATELSFRVDGRRLPTCADVALAPGELVWPGTHVLEAVQVEGGGAR